MTHISVSLNILFQNVTYSKCHVSKERIFISRPEHTHSTLLIYTQRTHTEAHAEHVHVLMHIHSVTGSREHTHTHTHNAGKQSIIGTIRKSLLYVINFLQKLLHSSPTVRGNFRVDRKWGFLLRYIKHIENSLRGADVKQQDTRHQPNRESSCDGVVSSLLHDRSPGAIKQTARYQQLWWMLSRAAGRQAFPLDTLDPHSPERHHWSITHTEKLHCWSLYHLTFSPECLMCVHLRDINHWHRTYWARAKLTNSHQREPPWHSCQSCLDKTHQN